MVLRLKTRESRSLPGLPKGEDASSSLLYKLLELGLRSSRRPFAFRARRSSARELSWPMFCDDAWQLMRAFAFLMLLVIGVAPPPAVAADSPGFAAACAGLTAGPTRT